jgi:predicted transcriptional regulator
LECELLMYFDSPGDRPMPWDLLDALLVKGLICKPSPDRYELTDKGKQLCEQLRNTRNLPKTG